ILGAVVVKKMSQSTARSGRVVGDYLVGRQIGSGSFSVVSEARHRVHGTHVAIKEIAMGRLNKKLQESLMSEIYILRRINHPNIIRLIDMIESPGKVHLVLEYCRGGDLSVYIQSHGSVPEATAKHFMLQLDISPLLKLISAKNLSFLKQNLLLSTDGNDADLKIADFGFAREGFEWARAAFECILSSSSLGKFILFLLLRDIVATKETCRNIMRFTIVHGPRDYATSEADLWSVGAILFQLATGTTPFTGNSQLQLLQNILRSTGLQFPADCRDLSLDCIDLCQKLLRIDRVERLTFEEFFNHPFLSDRQSYNFSRSRLGSRTMDGFLSSGSSPSRNMEESSQEDCLPFLLDDDSSGPEGSPSHLKRTSSMKSSSGFNIDARVEDHRVDSQHVLFVNE
ncbi:hypothetical protein HID58_065205, partial [Brassica napus]